jgi:hypothetical protein
MRRTLGWCIVSSLLAAWPAAADSGKTQPTPLPQRTRPVALPADAAEMNGSAATIDTTSYNQHTVAHFDDSHSHGCRRSCEAGRYIPNAPKGHCEAIGNGLRDIASIAVDVPYSIYEWAKKIRNTVHHRGNCNNSNCSHSH